VTVSLLGMTKDTRQRPKRLNVIALRLDDDQLAELKAMAQAELRPLANLCVALIMEAVAARKAKKP
jgi:hypothetical protein